MKNKFKIKENTRGVTKNGKNYKNALSIKFELLKPSKKK